MKKHIVNLLLGCAVFTIATTISYNIGKSNKFEDIKKNPDEIIHGILSDAINEDISIINSAERINKVIEALKYSKINLNMANNINRTDRFKSTKRAINSIPSIIIIPVRETTKTKETSSLST